MPIIIIDIGSLEQITKLSEISWKSCMSPSVSIKRI